MQIMVQSFSFFFTLSSSQRLQANWVRDNRHTTTTRWHYPKKKTTQVLSDTRQHRNGEPFESQQVNGSTLCPSYCGMKLRVFFSFRTVSTSLAGRDEVGNTTRRHFIKTSHRFQKKTSLPHPSPQQGEGPGSPGTRESFGILWKGNARQKCVFARRYD